MEREFHARGVFHTQDTWLKGRVRVEQEEESHTRLITKE